MLKINKRYPFLYLAKCFCTMGEFALRTANTLTFFAYFSGNIKLASIL